MQNILFNNDGDQVFMSGTTVPLFTRPMPLLGTMNVMVVDTDKLVRIYSHSKEDVKKAHIEFKVVKCG